MQHRKGFDGQTVRQFAIALAFACITLSVIPGLLTTKSHLPVILSGLGFWMQLGFVIGLASIQTAIRLRQIQSRQYTTVAENPAIIREWERLTGPGWFARYLSYGILAGFAVGVPIGSLLAFGVAREPDDLLNGSRVLTILAFIGFTMCWTIPMAFAIRWAVARGYRSMAPQIRG